MNWQLFRLHRIFLLLVIYIPSTSCFRDENLIDHRHSTQLTDDTSKNKVELLGSVLKKHIHLLRSSSETKLDIIFLVDSSASVGKSNFGNELKFVRKLLADFVVDEDHTKVSVITFSSKRLVLRQIDYITPYHSEKHKCTLIEDDLPTIKYRGGGTYTLGAFREAKKVLNKARRNSEKAIFLITDGFSNGGDPRHEAKRIRESGVKIFTFGIANGNRDELWDMSSEPKNETSYILDSFEEFESLARRALHEDLGRGDFIQQPEEKCDNLCYEGYECCDKKASCNCGTYTGTYECICQPGYYGNGRVDSCKPCPPGTYKSRAVPGDVRSCTRCPDENHTTFKGSTDVSQCVCKKGYRDFNNTGCVAMRCPALTAPRNGYFVNDKCENVFNAACGIRCKPGYYMKGSSLRICQENAEWSGKPTECIMKTCPALPKPKNGKIVCDKDGFLFSTVCRFSCDLGYKLVGSRKRQCLAIAAWAGINTKCREITCRPLPLVKDGKIFPSACTKGDVPFGTTCQISCYHGYSAMGPPTKQCTPDGLWTPSSEGEMTHCEDTSPPIMKCPRNVYTDADADDSSAEVSWQPPVALDNSGIRPRLKVVPAIEPPKRFPIGITKVKYIAEDLSENKVKCSFTVRVRDRTPPMVDRCVSPFPFVTSEPYANVTWEEPEFSDNSGTVELVERNHAPGLFPQGETTIVYKAFDSSGNNNTCNIIINVIPHSCQYPPAPVNGKRDCFETDEGVHCRVSCNEGFAFAKPPADDYFCAYDHKWRPEDKLPIPDCSVETLSNSVIQPASVTYIGNVPCGEQLMVNKIESIFNQQVSERISSLCGNSIECEIDSIVATCEEDQEFNRVKLIYNDRNKRSVRRHYRRRQKKIIRKQRSQKKKKSYAITFTFILKGKKIKIRGKDSKKLEQSVEKVIKTVKAEASSGIWDLKMNGRVRMQFANLTDSEEATYQCENGSILINTSCVKCPVGTMLNVETKECDSCLRGYYQPNEGQLSCRQCPKLTSTHYNNSKSKGECIALCQPGTFSKDGLEQCTTCPIGTYQNLYGQVLCISCPRNTTTNNRGMRRQDMCRGKCIKGYVSETGLQPCLPCPRNTYQSEEGNTKCLVCPGGGYTDDVGSINKESCSGGTSYQSDELTNIDFDECFGNKCQNGATCESRGGFGFDCICPPGFTGVYCDKELDECETEPCLHGGTCVDLKIDYSCKCAAGFTGKKCEFDIDECIPKPCLNNGTCVDGINGYTCSCSAAYEGERCELPKNNCLEADCRNGGTCINNLVGYTCQCIDGYEGINCEINTDDCADAPCQNDATCVDRINGFTCQCLDGYEGDRCDVNINECLDEPCQNGATCVDFISSFKCFCPKTFSGKFCETELNGDYMLDFPNAGIINYATMKMETPLSAFTVAFWMKTLDEINQGTPFSYSVGAFDNALTITNYDGFVIYVNNDKRNTDVKANDGTWHHIVVTWASNRGTWKIYQNGFPLDGGYNLAAGQTIRGGGKIAIGQEQDKGGTLSPTESFIGYMTNLNMWSRELSLTEIENMLVSCDKFLGDVIAWPDVQSGLQGDLQPTPSGFCKDCPIPSKPVNGQLEYNGTTTNSIVTYTCPRGYNMNGRDRRLCLVTSQWEDLEPSCERVVCDFPGGVKNGYIIGNDFSFDNRIRYTCNSGYRLEGNTTRYCTEYGTWDVDAPKCKEITCSLPLLSDNTIVSNTKPFYRSNEIVKFSCKPGKRLFTTYDSISCQGNGDWDKNVPTCDEQTCKTPPPIINGGVVRDRYFVEDLESYSVGYEVTYNCDYGHEFSEGTKSMKGKVHCLPSGEWDISNLPECVTITCPTPPTVLYATRSYESVEFTSTVEYECEEGYTIDGESVLECYEDGSWSHNPPICDPVDCGPLEAPVNTLINSVSTTYGSTAVYQCEPGYILTGNVSTRECLVNGSWSNKPPRCLPVSCGRPDKIEHGSFRGDIFTFKSTVIYICNPGYNIIGQPVRSCTGTGAWTSNLPTCGKIECEVPVVIENGYYRQSSPFYFEDIVNYQCQDGFNINGIPSIQCQSNGEWSPLSAVCLPVSCSPLTNSSKSTVYVSSSIFRGEATYTCKNGYMKDDTLALTRVCQRDGTWSGANPCFPISCPSLGPFSNGLTTVTGITYLSTANYSCNEGYRLVGQSTRECQSNKTWSGTKPTCKPITCPSLPAPTGGSIETDNSNLTDGTYATYSCNNGYSMEGESIRVCQADGSWSGSSPLCNPRQCPELTSPLFGTVTASALTFNSVATYSCNFGYQLDGQNSTVCQDNGAWSGLAPVCNVISCPSLSAPTGGRIETDKQDLTDGTYATFYCNDGYIMVGESIRVCQSEGYWSGSSPVCNPVQCDNLSNPSFGFVSTSRLTLGGVATYSCDEGYQIVGASTRKCQVDGEWSGKVPLCSAITCPVLYSPFGGSIDIDNQNIGGIAVYSCNDGYVMEGENTRICQSEGIWSGNSPQCNKNTCSPPPNLQNGRVSYKDLHVNSVAIFQCYRGFRLVGDDVRRCSSNLTWSGIETNCIPIICPSPPNINNGFVRATGLTFNSIATFSCKVGFQLEGSNELTCGSTSDWSDAFPTCKAIECQTPTRVISNGRMIGNNYTYGNTVTYECDIGYNLVGSQRRTCLQSGKWSEPLPLCEVVRCVQPRLRHGSASSFKNEYGTRIQFSCNRGYILFGSIDRLCLSNGSWSGPDPVCVKCQSPPELENGFVQIRNELATYQCALGYTLVGNTQLECQVDGSWINELPLCIAKECDDLSIEDFPNGLITQTGYVYKDTVEFGCLAGYTLIGQSHQVCQADGTWSGSFPTCNKISCSGTFKLENGRISGDNTFNSSLSFTCNIGFRLVGHSSLTCMASGEWSGTAPLCDQIRCPTLPSFISHGLVIGSEVVYGATVTYICDTGYILIGPSVVECQETGDWNSSVPSCQIKHCEKLQLYHGTLSSNDTEYRTSVTFSCDEGFVIFGSRQRSCSENGTWTGLVTQCVECSDPPYINNTRVIVSERIATFTCIEGYQSNSQTHLECQRDGTWNGTFHTCEAISCENLQLFIFPNGNMSQSGHYFGDTVDYSCNEGYNITGSRTRQCQADGSWTGATPVCFQVSCPGNFSIINGRVRSTGFTYKSNITFSCRPGYHLIGDPLLTCELSGKWSGDAPFCELIRCELLSNIEHGIVSYTAVTVGSEATYACDRGYELIGQYVRECQNDQFWSGSEPQCIQMVCPTPPPLQNGHFTGEYTVGSLLSYSCDVGYRLSTSPIRICSLAKVWLGEDPKCEIVKCTQPSKLLHGTITNSKLIYAYGDKINYQCDEGYQLTGEVERTCSADGRWLGIAPTCDIITCNSRALNVINNAHIFELKDSYSYGSNITIECNDGYTSIEGKSVITRCESDGDWSVKYVECFRMTCPPLGSLGNVEVKVTGLSYNDVVKFSCSEGFRLVGPSEIMCLSSGNWNSPIRPSCEIMTCPPPESVSFGQFRGMNYTYSNTITYECNAGYTLDGDSERMCLANGRWSGRQPRCEIVTCLLPLSPANGQWNTTASSLPYNTIIGFTCNTGYTLNGGPTRQCSESGNWDGAPASCSIITCQEPANILNGRVSYSLLNYNSEVEYACDEGYELDGDSKIVCLSLGTWSKLPPTCVPVACGVPDYVQFANIIGDVYTYGNSVTYKCKRGFTVSGEPSRVCTADGAWSGEVPSCNPVTCGRPPNIDHAIRNGTNFNYGGTISYNCIDGYRMNGLNSLTCGITGAWIGDLPFCNIVSCGPPPVIPFSTTTVTGLTYGSTVSFLCNRGYILEGDQIAICEANGRWKSGGIFCRPVSCGQPPDIQNGNARYDSITFRSSATYSCNDGFSIVGSATISCGSNGHWEGPSPQCNRSTCGSPKFSGNVKVIGGGSYSIGETVTFRCPEGHILIGNTESRCMSSGHWSGAQPACRYTPCETLSRSDPALIVSGVQNRTYHYKDELQFDCQEGYILQGKSRIQCLSNGSWSASVPNCHLSLLQCRPSILLPHTHPAASTSTGSHTYIQCSTGYQSEGNMTAVCATDQKWRPPTGYCKRTFCGKPRITDMVNVVMVTGRSYFYNDEIRFRCRPGILPAKIPPILTCTASGKWDGEIACSLPCKGGCYNGGHCLGLYGCKCPVGFGGRRCEKAYCILPCLNGGTCIAPHLCSCHLGYRGSRCQTPICDRPCQFGGLCVKPNMCHCKHGFRKPFCDPPLFRTLPPFPTPVTFQPDAMTTRPRLISGGMETTTKPKPIIRPTATRRPIHLPTPTQARTINLGGGLVTIGTKTASTTNPPFRRTRRPVYLDYLDMDYSVNIPDPR